MHFFWGKENGEKQNPLTFLCSSFSTIHCSAVRELLKPPTGIGSAVAETGARGQELQWGWMNWSEITHWNLPYQLYWCCCLYRWWRRPKPWWRKLRGKWIDWARKARPTDTCLTLNLNICFLERGNLAQHKEDEWCEETCAAMTTFYIMTNF